MNDARDALARLGEAFGDADGMVSFHDAIVAPEERFELGVALNVGASGSSLLVSYNPRIRAAAPRARILIALERFGFDTRAARAMFALVAVEHASVVLGLEWAEGAPTSATLYLEEISRFHDAREIAVVERDLARLVGVATPVVSAPGSTYIWALDLVRGVGRPIAFKVYRDTTDTPSVLASARHFTGGALDARCEHAWSAGALGSGWILQRRHARDQAPRLKIYKTYPYEAAPSADADAETRILLRMLPIDARAEHALELVHGATTSCGVAFEAGSPTPRSVTAYWRLAPQLQR